MNKTVVVIILGISSVLAFAQPSKLSALSPQHSDLQNRLDQIEQRMNQMIANHDKLMVQLKHLEDNLDRWQQGLHKVRMKIEGK